jgi:NSS family neurotransmitter:Na+ symporter
MARDHWGSRLVFILASVGSAAGLGNIWRFPYLAGKFGGGAFLLPYLLLLLLLGIPLLMLEFGLGQRMQKGAVSAFEKINKKYGAIGIGALLVGFAVSTYYTVIMAWTLLYTVYSFSLAWGTDPAGFFSSALGFTSPGVISSINPVVLGALALVWVILYFSVWKGISEIGKLVKFLVPIPLILLSILFIKGITLPNAFAGIAYYLTPNFSALLDLEVWMVALSQIFFSLSIGFGIMIAYGSYQKKKANITRNAIIIALSDSFIAIFGGLVVFATLGFMSAQQNVPVSELAASGPHLAFIVFPQALSLMPFASVFAVIFFLMLFLLGLSSQISMTEALVTSLGDKWPRVKKEWVTFGVCAACFLAGIVYTTDGGIFILDIVDHFAAEYGLLLVGLAEVLVISWVFGAEKMRKFIDRVSKWKIGHLFSFAIKYLAPVLITILLVTQFVTDVTKPYENYPLWMLLVFGWALLATIVAISALYFWEKS